ncbi:MAG: hypothetical protein H6707_02635 [Deltaproteobacteria bacterium]|nr:hypothetical protein [Deltaproteobacteria bacterium]
MRVLSGPVAATDIRVQKRAIAQSVDRDAKSPLRSELLVQPTPRSLPWAERSR